MTTGSARRRSALGIAAGGVLLGHWLTYAAMAPDAHRRAAELAATGHTYLDLANDLGVVAALVGAAAVFLSGLTHRERPVPSMGALALRLAAFQVAAFVSMEVLERVSAGAPVGEALHHGILPVGLLIQVGIAALAALLIRWLLRASERFEAMLGAAPARRRALSIALAPATRRLPTPPLLFAAGIRGPPLRSSLS